MKRMKNFKAFSVIIFTIIAALIIGVAVPTIARPHSTVAQAKTASIKVGELWNSTTKKFNTVNLNDLATKAGYSDISAMVNAGKSTTPIKSSTLNKKGEFVVTLNGIEWIPAYLSNASSDGTGDTILTLWRAESTQVGFWSDDSYSDSSKVTPYCNVYGTSYIRAVSLNNGGTWYGGYNGDNAPTIHENTKQIQPSELTSANRYTGAYAYVPFTTGDLKSYICTPSQVYWQANENKLKNDLANSTEGYNTDLAKQWQNDKVWLPSMYEAFDSAASMSQMSSNTDNGGLWNTSRSQRAYQSNAYSNWSRTAYSLDCGQVYIISSHGDMSGYRVTNKNTAVRPAIHLNLSEAEKNAHTHVWQKGEDTDADGWKIVTPATCNTYGVKERVCTADGCTLSDNKQTGDIPFDSTVHKFSTEWSSDKDNHWHAATCGHSSETKDKAAHTWNSGTVTTEPSCMAAGVKTYTCTVCSHTKTAPVEKIPHDYETAVTAPTCTEQGYTTHTCKRDGCGDTFKDTYTDPLDHDFSVKVSGTPATCQHGGSAVMKCSRCTEQTTVTSSGPVAHSFTNYESNNNATCTADGTKTAQCDYSCGTTDTITDSGSMLAHDYNDVVTEPTCTEQGYTTHTCKRDGCGDIVTDTYTDAQGHDYNDVVTAPTCTEQGYTTHTCKRDGCGDIVTDTYTDALGHNYVAAEGGVAPTCTTEGSGKLKCSRCNDEKVGETIPALGHNWAKEWTKDENNHWHTCSRCPEQGEFGAHSWNDGEITSPGVRTFTCTACSQTKVENFDPEQNEIWGLTLVSWAYGDPANTPVANAKFGEITYTYSDGENGEFSAAVPTYAGEYWVKATVAEAEDGTYTAAEIKANFEITKRRITVTINGGSSEQGAELEALTATVTSGSIVSGDTGVYELSTDADKETFGNYTISGTCLNDNYDITFENGVYIVSKRADDPHGGGSIDIPADANVEFKVTQSKTTGDYSELDGLKVGYWAQLWYRNGDGTLGDEYTENLNCILTLKIPTEIIEAIRGGEEINRDKIAAGLGVYYATDSGLEEVKAFSIAQREDESWIVKFNYNSKFRAEVVFNAPEAEVPAEEPTKSGGIPWWVWLISGIGGATLVTVIIVAVVLSKKKANNGGNAPAPIIMQGGKEYDDAELKAQLAAQSKRIDELANRDDGGFGDIYNGDL